MSVGDRPHRPEPLPHPVVDNHCHLEMALDGTAPWTVAQALEASTAVGVPRIVQIGCELESARWSVHAAESHDALVAGVALHPNEAPRLDATGTFEQTWADTGTSVRIVGGK